MRDDLALLVAIFSAASDKFIGGTGTLTAGSEQNAEEDWVTGTFGRLRRLRYPNELASAGVNGVSFGGFELAFS
ncbi:hypothetical protein AYJ54_37410 [Bradyrhizobium centrolobii]|uniref:Uncharacterized protein n=1 Tax=Bradyrhizobium centrolobii TaxID=1505087 RepID=A0A176Z8M2_9BRAD|nr:hypothetical protein [Bradyrhizobium centrolobii]OAF17029.1 hypothetical protein AYJ54_37410 [Bradyrhizobium centrolobii]